MATDIVVHDVASETVVFEPLESACIRTTTEYVVAMVASAMAVVTSAQEQVFVFAVSPG